MNIFIKNVKIFTERILEDERGSLSSRRLIGICGAIVLFSALIIDTVNYSGSMINDALIGAVLTVTVSALGFASADKIWGKRQRNSKDEKIYS